MRGKVMRDEVKGHKKPDCVDHGKVFRKMLNYFINIFARWCIWNDLLI